MFGKVRFLASLLFSQMVNVQTDLVQVSSGFRDGRNGHHADADHRRCRERVIEYREHDLWSDEQVA